MHSGILASAAALNLDLEDHGILNALLTGAAVDKKAKERHTTQGPPPMDDALVAAFAGTPEAAVFLDLGSFEALQGRQILAIPCYKSMLSLAMPCLPTLGAAS